MRMLMLVAAGALLAACSDNAAQDRLSDNESPSAAEAPPGGESDGEAERSDSSLADAEQDESSASAAASHPSENPCTVQDGESVAVGRVRAVGTEPFWAARVEGRCVTYLTPEDQQGTRIWARFSGDVFDGTWSGVLGGQPFELRTRNAPGCSDGMSNKIYPLEATLLVGGEERRGCAEGV